MRSFNSLANYSPEFIGSGTRNTENAFNWMKAFKRLFSKELERINGTDFDFSIGHFYFSCTFQVNGQYFNLFTGDIRGKLDRVCIRKCDDPKDYTGKTNYFVEVQNDMIESIARTFKLELKEKQYTRKRYNAKEIAENIVNGKIKDELKIASNRNAVNVACYVLDLLGDETSGVFHNKRGRRILKTYVDSPVFEFDYNPNTKIARFNLKNKI